MAREMAAEFTVAVRAGLFEHRARAFMDADRDAEVRGGFIDRKIVGARERAAAEFVRSPENAVVAEFLFGVFQFCHRARRVLKWNQANTVQPFGIVTAI